MSTVKGKLPVSSVVFGPEDLARYGVAIDNLSSDDEESSRSGRTTKCRNRGTVNPDERAANSDGWAFKEMTNASQLTDGENHQAPLPPRARGRHSGSQRGQTNAKSRTPPIAGHRRRRSETSETPARHKRSRTANTQVSRTPTPDSDVGIGERSHEDSGESSDGGDIPSSERYDQKERIVLESETESESEQDTGCWGKLVSSDEEL
jgi:hypothetical protein